MLGAENVLDSAIRSGVRKVICLSTDKAVYPINAMGMSKALMEKVMVAKSRHLDDSKTVVCGTRYGNVMASRGSIIPLMAEQIMRGRALTLTDPLMTRFMMTLDDALDLVLFAFENATNGDIFVQKAPAATIETLSLAMKQIFGKRDFPDEIIGTRHGEKLFEVLLSREEMVGAEDKQRIDQYFSGLRDLEKQFDRQLTKPDPREACVAPKALRGDIATGVDFELVNKRHQTMTDILVMALACDQTRVINVSFTDGLSALRRKGHQETHHIFTHEEPINRRKYTILPTQVE